MFFVCSTERLMIRYSRTCDAGGQLLPRELKSFDVARHAGSLVQSHIPLSLSHFSFSSIHLFVLFPFSRVYVSYSFLINIFIFIFIFSLTECFGQFTRTSTNFRILKLKIGQTSCGLKDLKCLASVRFELATSLKSLLVVFSYSLDQTRTCYSYLILFGNVRWPAKYPYLWSTSIIQYCLKL